MTRSDAWEALRRWVSEPDGGRAEPLEPACTRGGQVDTFTTEDGPMWRAIESVINETDCGCSDRISKRNSDRAGEISQ